MDEQRKIDPIPESFATIDAAADFWDSHDTADYWDEMQDVEVDIQLTRHRQVAVAEQLMQQLAMVARQQGVSLETLINMWLQERLIIDSQVVAETVVTTEKAKLSSVR